MAFRSSEKGSQVNYISAIKLDIPPGFKNLSASLKQGSLTLNNVADIFLKNLDGTAKKSKLGVKYSANGQKLIYLLDSENNTIRKLEINVTGTLVEYTWRGAYRERLRYAKENNTFNPPGFSTAEVKNLYH